MPNALPQNSVSASFASSDLYPTYRLPMSLTHAFVRSRGQSYRTTVCPLCGISVSALSDSFAFTQSFVQSIIRYLPLYFIRLRFRRFRS